MIAEFETESIYKTIDKLHFYRYVRQTNTRAFFFDRYSTSSFVWKLFRILITILLIVSWNVIISTKHGLKSNNEISLLLLKLLKSKFCFLNRCDTRLSTPSERLDEAAICILKLPVAAREETHFRLQSLVSKRRCASANLVYDTYYISN